MVKVEFGQEFQTRESPIAFQVFGRRYGVKKIVDQWFGVGETYFKVEADDNNIYLLKHEEGQDYWDLIFYQNPALMGFHALEEASLIEQLRFRTFTGKTDRMSLYLN
ncbi:MAG TPA: hypothetical protein EYQ84_02680 [Nitrospinaceae bacterium]|jgi:hypothetical protein|nr:hypothetical protein [Nitrospinaceae bacterium]HIL26172.1 hypothetical protein [Nitrospinaceae bacterium]